LNAQEGNTGALIVTAGQDPTGCKNGFATIAGCGSSGTDAYRLRLTCRKTETRMRLDFSEQVPAQ